MIEPIVLFGIQFTLSLVAYSLVAAWYGSSSTFPMTFANRKSVTSSISRG